MKRVGKWLALGLALAFMTMTIAGCGATSQTGSSSSGEANQTSGGAAAEGKKVGLILPGGRGDMSICDAMYNGVVAAQEQCGFEFDTAEVINASDPEYFLREFADAQEYDLTKSTTWTALTWPKMARAPTAPGTAIAP